MPANNTEIEKRPWDAADELRANSRLRAADYSRPVLGLIFLRYAGHRFDEAHQQILAERAAATHRLPPLTDADYHARGVLYVPEEARFDRLLNLPEGENIGRAINDAMKAIEDHNLKLKDVLPKTYNRLGNDTLKTLLKAFHSIEIDVEGDIIGKIYEYFLGRFAMAEGQRGGEFFTPTSLVKLIVEILEPYHGLILDPACGSGGMFVQSARFVERHQQNPSAHIQQKRTMEGGFADSPIRLNRSLAKLDRWDERAIVSRAQELAQLAIQIWAYPQLTAARLDNYREAGRRRGASYTLADHPNLSGGIMDLFQQFRRRLLHLDPSVTEEILKNWIAYETSTNFVDVVVQKRRLLLTLNMRFDEVVDPCGLCRDVTGKGKWGNGDVQVPLSSPSQIDAVMELVEQSFRLHADNGDMEP
jgi:predicted transport protein